MRLMNYFDKDAYNGDRGHRATVTVAIVEMAAHLNYGAAAR